jgi:Transcriptional regulator
MDEILDAAETLFTAKGYHETAVSDIVKKVGVSQGTFYYYFVSKEAALDAIVNRRVARIQSKIEEIVGSKEESARKIELIVYTTFNNLRSGDGWMLDFLYNEQYLHIVDRYVRHTSERLSPSLLKVIEEGNRSGCFTVAYPAEVMEFITAILKSLFHTLYQRLSAERLALRFKIASGLFEKILGLKEGALHLTL